MGLRKILNLEKLKDVKLNETKKSSSLGSRKSYDALKIKTYRYIASLYSREFFSVFLLIFFCIS
jgi:hypothetical protein